MRDFSGMRLGRAVIVSFLALTLVSTLAACGGASTGSTSGATGASANSRGCKSDLEFDFARTDHVAGHVRDLFLILNDSTSPCTLKGYPIVTVDDSSITVTTTTTADTWSNVAIQPVTLTSSNDANITPNDLHYFAVQGRDDTTNCKLLSPSFSFTSGTAGSPTSVITICGGELFVSPVVPNTAAFNE